MASECGDDPQDVERPGIQIISPEADVAYNNGHVHLNILFTDNEGLDEFTIRVKSEDGSLTPIDTVGLISGKEARIEETKMIHVPDHSDYIITVIATDEAGNTEEVSVQFHLHPTGGSGDIGGLNIKFKLQYDGQTMTLPNLDGNLYPGNDMPFFLNKFAYYLTGVGLTTSHGHVEELTNADAYLKLEDDHHDVASAEEGTTHQIHGITAGSYTGIKFNIGVPESINNLTPNQFAPDSPFALDGEYWTSWGSYVFCKIEGKGDMNGDMIFDDPVMALHLGADEALRTLEFTKDFQIHAGAMHTLEFVIDVKKVFDNDGTIYDILGSTDGEANARIHKLTQMPRINELCDNLVEAFELQ